MLQAKRGAQPELEQVQVEQDTAGQYRYEDANYLDLSIKSIDEVPEAFRFIFPYETFNLIQSSAFNLIYRTDANGPQ